MISQIELCAEIMKHLDRKGIKDMLPRQVNAIIAGANLICDEFAKPYRPVVPRSGWAEWLKSDETGTSSEYLLHAIKDHWNKRHVKFGYPHDPGDFGRCVGLLDAEPSFRPRICRVMTDHEQHGAEWAAIASNWDELEALYRAELPSGKAPKLMSRMKELIGS